jgi:geranylgeranyl diphosphate synthase type II
VTLTPDVDDLATLDVGTRLQALREPVDALIESHLRGREPARWLWDLAAVYPRRGGKGIRSGLCLATAVAFGGRLADAVPTAAMLEVMHNAFLVRDDIEDGSELRRGEPTLHQLAGLPLAVNAGDALLLAALELFDDHRDLLPRPVAARLAREMRHTLTVSLEGQAIELGWQFDRVVELTPDDYLAMIMRKTCWYTTIQPLRAGALIGSGGRADLDRLVRFGSLLGAAFQIRDDLLNLVGDVAQYGKELAGDLREGKRTLMMIHLLDVLRGAELARLVAFLDRDREDRTDDEIAWVLERMHATGSIDFATEFAAGIAAEAAVAYDDAFTGLPPSLAADLVRDLVPYMLDRSR